MNQEVCPFCKTGKVKKLYSATKDTQERAVNLFTCTNCGFGKHGPINKCATCGIFYVDDAISQQKISEFYEISEDEVYLAEQNAREATFKYYLSKLKRVAKSKGKLLDIGTHTGLFVKLAREEGFKAVGLEPNKQAVQFAASHYGLDLINEPFEKNTFPPNSLDVITMWDVIEHFTDPVVELEKVYKTLKQNGVFAFSTVDPESLVARIWATRWPWYMEMHRVFLSERTARFYLTKVGFKKIIFKPHFRFFSLAYAANRFMMVNSLVSTIASRIAKIPHLGKVLVPYYANDLYDCYAFK